MKRFSTALAAVLCLFLLAGLIRTAIAKVVASPPVKVNVVGGTTISDAKIKDIVKEANKILGQADVSLDADPNVSRNVDDEGNHDDKIQTGEDAKLDEAGQKEINKEFGNGVGLKVYFTNQIHDDNDILGCAPHVTEDANGNLEGKPIIYVKNDPCRTNKQLGRTLAHESCHVFTLGDEDVIDINDSLDFIKSDANGHVNFDSNNLMCQSGLGDGNYLTLFQRNEIFIGAARLCKKLKYVESTSNLIPPKVTTMPQIRGGWVDDMEDVMPPLGYNDLGAGFFYAQHPLANLEFSILTEGLYPGFTDMLYTIYINSDGNPLTGDPAPIPGVDKVIEIIVTGEHPGGEVTAHLQDTASGIVTFLPFASTQRIKKIIDHNTAPYAEPYVDGLYIQIPMKLLGENSGMMEGLVTSHDFVSGASDDVFFLWEDTTDTDPALTLETTQINPGDPITVTGENYAPYSEISIYVADELIGTTFADANGGFGVPIDFFGPGSDPFDGGVPADAVVRARDAEGGSDFSIVRIVPHEGDINADIEVDFFDVALLANNWLIQVD